MPNPNLLIGPLRRREALLSSQLEGTFTTVEELLMEEAGQRRRFIKSEAYEVHNYVRALEQGLNLLQELPMSNRLIREVHKRLMVGVRGHDKAPGEFRRHQNFIGRTKDIALARFVPPTVPEMQRCMGEFESYLHTDDDHHELVRLALVHYQFETIHPFMDGNGRIGRLMIVLLMCSWGLLSQPLLYLSPYFEKNSDNYKDLLLSVSQTGNWLDWVEFFLNGVTEQCADAIARSRKLLELQEAYRARVQSPRTSALALKLVDSLFVSIGINTKQAAALLEITNAAAQRNIDKLVDVGILEEITGGARDRFYLAREVVDIVNQDIIE